MNKEEAIERFNAPDYTNYGSDNHFRMYWFSGLMVWRRNSASSTSTQGIFHKLKEVGEELFEVMDNGRILQKLSPDIQVKWQLYQVDNIILGEDDE